jgi:hypothetical protein
MLDFIPCFTPSDEMFQLDDEVEEYEDENVQPATIQSHIVQPKLNHQPRQQSLLKKVITTNMVKEKPVLVKRNIRKTVIKKELTDQIRANANGAAAAAQIRADANGAAAAAAAAAAIHKGVENDVAAALAEAACVEAALAEAACVEAAHAEAELADAGILDLLIDPETDRLKEIVINRGLKRCKSLSPDRRIDRDLGLKRSKSLSDLPGDRAKRPKWRVIKPIILI